MLWSQLRLDLLMGGRGNGPGAWTTTSWMTPMALAAVTDAITTYFEINNPDEVSKMIIWEGHKAVIRGVLISQGSRFKKQKSEEIWWLIAEIQQLENLHKRSQFSEIESRPNEAHYRLTLFLDQLVKKRIRFWAHRFYEHSNKPGRMLASVLRKRKENYHVHKLVSGDGQPVFQSSRIARLFQEFYCNLYCLYPHRSPCDSTKQRQDQEQR